MRNSLIIAAVIFIGYGLFLEYGPKPVKVITQSQWQDNQYAVEKYLRDSKDGVNQHNVVIVGSSLAHRLDFNEKSSLVYNLSLSGDSALTGLSVIANSNASPRLVLIEINVPQRGINEDLVDAVTGILPKLSPIFNIENMPINLAYSFRFQYKSAASPNESAELVHQEPNESVLQNGIALHSKNNQELLSSDLLNQKITEFSDLIRKIETKGTKIIFFEMPVAPDLENSPRVLQIRNAFKTSFPKYKLLNYQDLTAANTIKTIDGIHLTSDAAKAVKNNLMTNCF
jgi:hypothetical protein